MWFIPQVLFVLHGTHLAWFLYECVCVPIMDTLRAPPRGRQELRSTTSSLCRNYHAQIIGSIKVSWYGNVWHAHLHDCPLYTWEWVVSVLVSVCGRECKVGGEKWELESWLDAELQSLVYQMNSKDLMNIVSSSTSGVNSEFQTHSTYSSFLASDFWVSEISSGWSQSIWQKETTFNWRIMFWHQIFKCLISPRLCTHKHIVSATHSHTCCIIQHSFTASKFLSLLTPYVWEDEDLPEAKLRFRQARRVLTSWAVVTHPNTLNVKE